MTLTGGEYLGTWHFDDRYWWAYSCLLMRTDTLCGCWWGGCPLPWLHLYCPWSPPALPSALPQYGLTPWDDHTFVNNQIVEKRWACLLFGWFWGSQSCPASGVNNIWKTGGWFYFVTQCFSFYTRCAQLRMALLQPVLTTPGFAAHRVCCLTGNHFLLVHVFPQKSTQSL